MHWISQLSTGRNSRNCIIDGAFLMSRMIIANQLILLKTRLKWTASIGLSGTLGTELIFVLLVMLADKSVKSCLIVRGLTSRVAVKPDIEFVFQRVEVPSGKVRANTHKTPV